MSDGERARLIAERRSVGNEGQERRERIPAGQLEEFDRLVEGQRVGAVGRQERARRGDPPGGRGRERIGRPTTDVLAVAADGVDLAVVSESAEWLGEAPDRVGVRRVALVEHDEVDRVRRRKVRVEAGEAVTGDEALVDDEACRCRRDREVAQAARTRARLRPTTGRGEAKLEPIRRPRRRPEDHGLRDRWHRRGGLASESGRVGRDVAPARHRQTLGGEGIADDPAAARRAGRAGQEGDDDADPTSPPEARGEEVDDGRVKRQRYAGPVARLAVGSERASVSEGGQASERQRQDPLPRHASGVGHEPDAAGVVLERRVEQVGPSIAPREPVAPARSSIGPLGLETGAT